MKVGDYVRIHTLSGQGGIAKLEKIDNICITDNGAVDKNNIIKSSPNIIDLIEVGDYVNGLPVRSVEGTRFDENDLRVWLAVATEYVKEYGVENSDGDYEFDTLYRCIKPENIKSIVTKEQFEVMQYNLEGQV